jgi:hypothetical protein
MSKRQAILDFDVDLRDRWLVAGHSVGTSVLDFVDIDDTPEAFWSYCDEYGYGDGLPMIPPTPERVDAMLASLGEVDHDEVVATLPPRLGRATRRVIAINAVLAGCAPACLPVLVTAVRAIANERINIRGINATTHPAAPLLIVSGDIARTAGYNGSSGAFGPGNRANSTTGRALRLILMHVAGAIPGLGDASTQGGPAKYTYCVAENIDDSPWESYSKSIGVDASSTVTVHCGEAPHNLHDMTSDHPARLLDMVSSVMTSMGQNNAAASSAEYFIALSPEHAATIAARGWTRRDVSSYLFQHARLPARDFRAAFETLAWDRWMSRSSNDELLPMTGHPDNIRVFVCGGAGKHSAVIPSWGITKSVTLPVQP